MESLNSPDTRPRGGIGGFDPQRLLFACSLGLAAAVALWFIYLAVPLREWLGADFGLFWTAAQLEGLSKYDFEAVTAALGQPDLRPFVHPPSFLIAIEPLVRMPLWTAFGLWTVLSLALFGYVTRYAAGPAALLVLLAAPAFHWAVIAGQITLVVGGLLYLGMIQLSRRPVAAGILFACAALLKPQAVLLLPIALIAGGNVRALLSTLAAGTIAGLLCLLVQGPELWFEWLGAMREFVELIRANGFMAKGISPAALAHSLGAGGAAGIAIISGGALLGVGCCWRVFRRSDDPAIRGGSLICGSLLCTPYALPYEAASLLPAAAALLTRRGTDFGRLIPAAIAVSFPFSPLAVALFAAALSWGVSGRSGSLERPEPAEKREPASTTC